jgi:hypothetical protein
MVDLGETYLQNLGGWKNPGLLGLEVFIILYLQSCGIFMWYAMALE